MADLALMSWALWLLGDVDTAITRLDAAIQRADAIESSAFAGLCKLLCVRSPRSSWRVVDCAQLMPSAVSPCRTNTDSDSGVAWHAPSGAYA